MDTTAANASAPPSIRTSPIGGSVLAATLRNARFIANASATPATPPPMPYIALSVSTCRISRSRPAPRAARTPSSRRRAVARERKRPAMLTHSRWAEQ